MSVRAGTLLDGRYLLSDRIAVGGMGEVWRGTDEWLGRPVAIKVLRAELAEDEAFRKRFRAEAKTAAKLPHNGIAAVYDYGETSVGPDGVSPSTSAVQGDGIAYLVMELVPGEPLSAILHREGALDTQRTLSIVAQAAHALHVAHERGVVHRDVKPANLMVTPDGIVKITDFGIARPTDHEPLTMTGQVMGTAHYLAPELARGLDASPLSDVYALGVVAYECLAGHRPFEGENQVLVATAHLNQQPPPLPGTIPPEVVRIVSAAMEKDPQQRIRSSEAFGDALDKLAAHDPSALDGITGRAPGRSPGLGSAQAPQVGPGGALLGPGGALLGPGAAAADAGVGTSPTTRTTRMAPAPSGTWNAPATSPDGVGTAGGPPRFGPPQSGYGQEDDELGTGSGRRRQSKPRLSPALLIMLALLALVILLLLWVSGGEGGRVNLGGDEPTPSATQSSGPAGLLATASTTPGASATTSPTPSARATTSTTTRPPTPTPTKTTAPPSSHAVAEPHDVSESRPPSRRPRRRSRRRRPRSAHWVGPRRRPQAMERWPSEVCCC